MQILQKKNKKTTKPHKWKNPKKPHQGGWETKASWSWEAKAASDAFTVEPVLL